MSEQVIESIISRVDAWNAFEELRRQAADVPDMSLDEINAELKLSEKREGVA